MSDNILVTVDNFVRAETERMFAALQAQAGGINCWAHNLTPTPLDQQTVVRMNRDTLYSMAIIDLAEGATVTVPDAGGRYVSVMVVNGDHHINDIFTSPGRHELTIDQFDTRYVAVALRVLVDPADPADVTIANEIQHGLVIEAGSAVPFELPPYDTASLDATRHSLLELGRPLGGFSRAFGSRADTDPIRHLIGTAVGWGGLPEHEAFYLNVDLGLPVADYRIVVRDVPVDAFWSVSLYDADGFFLRDASGGVSVNSVTAQREEDGAVVVNLGAAPDGRPNFLQIVDGWNYAVRMYRPHPEILDGSWTFPEVEPVA